MTNTFLLLSRLGLSLIFILSGASKIAGYDATQHYMAAMGVSGSLLPLVIALELGGGLALLAGPPPSSSAITSGNRLPDTPMAAM